MVIPGTEAAARQRRHPALSYLTLDDDTREVALVPHLKDGRVDALLAPALSTIT